VLEQTAARLGADTVRVEVADAAVSRAADEDFDRVLVDPPCTGLGTLQAHPDLRWRVAPGDAERLSALQGQILEAGARALRPGGVLVYSTCTVSPTENERLIAAFLDSHPGFGLDDPAAELPGPAFGSPAPPGQRCLITLPHRDATAGFYIARIRRR
jgi:16S rRNA (cytosine967-C5)-methyltransferase